MMEIAAVLPTQGQATLDDHGVNRQQVGPSVFGRIDRAERCWNGLKQALR